MAVIMTCEIINLTEMVKIQRTGQFVSHYLPLVSSNRSAIIIVVLAPARDTGINTKIGKNRCLMLD